jgi:hypothetical protein
MKKGITHKQRGFFDLGISLIILAIGSVTTAAVVSNNEETKIAEEQPVVTSAVERHELLAYDMDDC